MMKKIFTLFALIIMILPLYVQAQDLNRKAIRLNDWAQLNTMSRSLSNIDSLPVNAALKPFYHGVASGDPMPDRVIIWTRYTPDSDTGNVTVDYAVATDTNMSNVVSSGTFTTDSTRDYTVKVDVTGLTAGTTYYYQFSVSNGASIIGRTKTAPDMNVDHLKFGVVSCSNYQHGYFNAYDRLGARNDLDAVIHLGDYIYEQGTGEYGDSALVANGERELFPKSEILQIEDYRTRYSLYRLDAGLMRAHQQHPFIVIWDDHESANDAYKDGAENHDPATEGSWETRKAISKKVYYEWLPIRENMDTTIYRTLSYGNLADVIMLDTRIEGRTIQATSILDSDFNDPSRTMLGATQKSWFLNMLSSSTAKWKIIGNQVIFAQVATGWFDPTDSVGAEDIFLDIWDGYPAERDMIINYIDSANIQNTVLLTGDFHSTFAFDIAPDPFDTLVYNSATGDGSVAVEFATPSITSANFDENLDATTSSLVEQCINQPCQLFFGTTVSPNPHLKFTDLDRHGYFILDVKEDSTQANYYYMGDILTVNENESFDGAWYTMDGENHLVEGAESDPKAVQDIPAPTIPTVSTSVEDQITTYLLGLYPNPATDRLVVQYAMNKAKDISVKLLSIEGKEVIAAPSIRQNGGVYTMEFDITSLPTGIYVVRLADGNTVASRKVVIK